MRNKCTTCRNYVKIISLTKIYNGTICIFLKNSINTLILLNIYTQQKVVCTGYSLDKKINFSYIIHFTKDKVFATGQKSYFT